MRSFIIFVAMFAYPISRGFLNAQKILTKGKYRD